MSWCFLKHGKPAIVAAMVAMALGALLAAGAVQAQTGPENGPYQVSEIGPGNEVKLGGNMSYSYSGDTGGTGTLTLQVGRVDNYSPDQTTGPLQVTIFSIPPGPGGRPAMGRARALTQIDLAPLRPNTAHVNLTARATRVALPPGTTLYVTLSERTGNGWTLRDMFTFAPARKTTPIPTAPQRGPSPDNGTPTDNPAETITDAHIQHNLNVLNTYRAKAGVPLLQLDARLTTFAQAGSRELMQNHVPHGHFRAAMRNGTLFSSGFSHRAAENQGDPHGWTPGTINTQIDQVIGAMFGEGPGGGHHDNILNRDYHRVGIGLLRDAHGRLYLTNDFSD